jgi:3-hydroxyisobutyrate dehydrogenase
MTDAVGWIGAGRMGSAMVTRLLEAGVPVVLWNRTIERARPLQEAGATVVADLEDVAALPVVFTSLASPADLDQVARRIARSSPRPEHVVDTSTVSVECVTDVARLLGAVDTRFLAAPVSGNPGAVRAGNAAFVCSGDAVTYERGRPVLETIGTRATYLGEGAEATIAKLGHNLMLAVTTQALAEVVTLCSQRGVEPAALMEFLNTSVLGSTFTAYKTPAIVEHDLTPTFTTRLLLKDVELGLAEGRETSTPLPVAAQVREALVAAIAQGHADDDFMSLLAVQARACGHTFPDQENRP